MTTNHKGFRLLTALLAILIVLASCPLTALAEEEIFLTAQYYFDEESGEHGDVYTDAVYDAPVVIEAAEGLYRSMIGFENCTFNEGITVYTAGEVVVFFNGTCEIEGGVTVNGTDYDVLREGGCYAEFHNVTDGTEFFVNDAKISADANTEQMGEPGTEFEDFCLSVNGVKMYALMPGFRFSTDVMLYNDGETEEETRINNLEVYCTSGVTAEDDFFDEYGIEITDGWNVEPPTLDIDKTSAGETAIYAWNTPFFEEDELSEDGEYPEGYVPAKLKVNGAVSGGSVRVVGSVDVSELAIPDGIVLIGTWFAEGRIDLGDHFALIIGDDAYFPIELSLGENGQVIDTVGMANLRAFCGDVFLSAGGAHIFGNGSVYIPGTRDDVEYKLFYNGEEIPSEIEFFPEENKTHLTVEYDNVPEDIVIGDEKFCTEYLMDISVGNAFVSVPVRHKSLVKAGPNGTRYNQFYFGEPITVFADCEEGYAYVDFNDCTFADGTDITVIPGKTQIDVNFWGETQMEDEDGEPNLFEVKTDDSRYAFNTNVFVGGLPAGYIIGDIECGHFGINGTAPGYVFGRNGVEITFGDKENARRGFCLDRNCNNWHDYEAWGDYPPHDDCSEEDQSSGIYVYGDIAGITVDGTSYDYVTTGQLCDDVTIELSGECGRNGYFSVTNATYEENLWNQNEFEEPVSTEAYARVSGGVSGVDTFAVSGRIDISGVELPEGTEIRYNANGVASALITGHHDVTVLPAGYGDEDFTVYAGESSNVRCPSYCLDSMTLYANGNDVLSLNGIYTENGDVILPFINADGTDYYVFANGERVFGDEGDEPEFSDGTTILRIPDEKKADAYDVSAWLNGAGLSTDCHSANTIIASENVTSVEGRTFSGEVNIITIGDKYNGLSSGVVFRDCIFENDTFINFTANDDNAFLRFEGETNVGENCFIRLRTDDDELKYGVNWTDINVENAPSGFVYLCDELDVNIGGESENDNYNICGAVVSTGDAENKWFNIRFCTNWYGEGDISKCLDLTDNIAGVEYIQSEEEDRPAINEFCFNRVYVSKPSVDLHVENRTGEHGMIRVRTSSPNPDDPWDVENWETSGWNTDSHAVITGDIFGFDLETTGSADISALDFDYGTEDCPTEIFIVIWDPVNYMNIGSQRVNISGNSELPVCITADEGAFIRENDQRQFVIINGGAEDIIDLSSAHIFGSGDYGVYIGKALSEEELDNIKLYCNSDEPNDYDYEIFPEEGKTHFYPNTEDNYGGDIGDWYLECTSGGITVLKRIVHKTWTCNHENRETHFIDGMEYPTCEHSGYVFYICPDCEHMWYDYEDMRSENGEHSPVTIEGFTATCTEDGLSDGEVCSVCGEVLAEQETIPATGHDFVRDEERDVPATCTEDGIEAYSCECGETDDATIPATGHDFVRDEERDIPATCTENGTEAYKCSADGCGATEEIVIYASGHSVEKLEGKAPTCTEDGLTTGAKCTKCETVLIKQEVIKATGHKTVTLPAVAPTCEEDGKTEGSYCAVCGESFTKQTTVPATGHTEAADEAVAVGCGKAGLTAGSHCSVCGKVLVKQETIPAKEHDFAADKDRSKEATCTEAGLEAYTCTLCGAYADITIMPAGHKVVKLAGTPATCTADGLTDGATCSVCHKNLIEQTTIKKTGHKAVVLPAVAATCTSTGLTEGSYCAVCEITLIEQITTDKLGHVPAALPAVAATCTSTGLTEGSKCSVCGEILTAQTVVPMTKHTEAILDAIAPTCITPGRTEGKYCSVCDKILLMPEIIGLTDHTSVKDNAVAPGCTTTGLTEGEHCLVCETVLKKQQNVPAAGHKWDEGTVTKAATCREAGVMTYTCSECSETKTEPIAKLTTHTYDAGKVTKAATCREAGEKTYTCTVCGDKKSESIAKLTAHTYENGKCTVCGAADPDYDPAPAFTYGDVDGNGKIEAADARLALRGSVGLTDAGIDFTKADSVNFLAADVDVNGKVEAADARLILRFSVGLENKLGK